MNPDLQLKAASLLAVVTIATGMVTLMRRRPIPHWLLVIAWAASEELACSERTPDAGA